MDNKMTYTQLLKYHRGIVKTANRRLDRLREAGYFDSKAYNYAKRMTAGTGKFSSKKPAGLKQLRKQVSAVERFLSMETSTLRGVHRIEKDVVSKIKDKYGLDLEPDQVTQVFEGGLWKKLADKYGSKTAIAVLASLQKTDGDIASAFKDLAEQNVYLSGRERKSTGALISNYMRQNDIPFLQEGF